MKAINQDYWDMYKYTFPIFFQSLSINQFIYRLKAKITANMKNNNLDRHRNRQGQKNIFDFKFEDFELTDYDPHPHIKGKVAV